MSEEPANTSSFILGEELTREARALFERDVGSVTLSLVSALVLLWALGLFLRTSVTVSARLGIERGRRLQRFSHFLQFVVLGLVLLGLVRSVARVAPLWVTLVLALVLVPIVIFSSGAVHDLVGGLVAQLRLRLAKADYIRIAELSGVVTRIGLTHLELRDESGALHRVPNRKLVSEPVELSAQRRAVPVELELLTPRALSSDEGAELAEITATSPFRASGTRVWVDRLAAPDRVRVRFSVWSQEAVAPARRQIERSLNKFAR
jgi:hypothetical protein